MRRDVISFLVGFIVGHEGTPWFVHAGYLTVILVLTLAVMGVIG